jgi:hypothetical protein
MNISWGFSPRSATIPERVGSASHARTFDWTATSPARCSWILSSVHLLLDRPHQTVLVRSKMTAGAVVDSFELRQQL